MGAKCLPVQEVFGAFFENYTTYFGSPTNHAKLGELLTKVGRFEPIHADILSTGTSRLRIWRKLLYKSEVCVLMTDKICGVAYLRKLLYSPRFQTTRKKKRSKKETRMP